MLASKRILDCQLDEIQSDGSVTHSSTIFWIRFGDKKVTNNRNK